MCFVFMDRKCGEFSQSQTLNIQSIQTSIEDIASMENSMVQNLSIVNLLDNHNAVQR